MLQIGVGQNMEQVNDMYLFMYVWVVYDYIYIYIYPLTRPRIQAINL
jgi:hypothetical protein